MKMPAITSSALLLLLCSAVPAAAQSIGAPLANSSSSSPKVNLDNADRPSFASDKTLSGLYQLPSVRKSSAELPEGTPVYLNQDVQTLLVKQSHTRKVESVVDLSVLKERSDYRSAAIMKLKVSASRASEIQAGLSEISAAYKKPADSSEFTDCNSVSLSVETRIKMDTSKVLEIVESEIAANSSCACEIVKIAIKASDADEALVGDIAEVAITTSPENMRMISQCAIAALPEALPNVQAVLAKLDPNRGDSSYSAKDAKDSKSAKSPIARAVETPEIPSNPLDLPPPFQPPIPPIYIPPSVTNPDPGP